MKFDEKKVPEMEAETGVEAEQEIEEKVIEKKPPLLKRFWKEWGDVVILLAAIFVVFKLFLQIAWVPTGSMETTIPARTVQLGWQLPYRLGDPLPKRGDVITFWSDECGEVLVKRVIGLPGETVSFDRGCVYIDGEKLEEDYLPIQGLTESPEQSFTVPEGCVFFMGDNRTGSFDARFWLDHYIPAEKLQAKVFLTISVGKNHSWTGIRLVTK